MIAASLAILVTLKALILSLPAKVRLSCRRWSMARGSRYLSIIFRLRQNSIGRKQLSRVNHTFQSAGLFSASTACIKNLPLQDTNASVLKTNVFGIELIGESPLCEEPAHFYPSIFSHIEPYCMNHPRKMTEKRQKDIQEKVCRETYR
jgi:hypothetical protein